MDVKQTRVDVLDHGFVRLVSYMQPATPSPEWDGDLEVVRNARVSYNADWRDSDGAADGRLLNYLYNNKHTSPFESMVFTFEVKAPLFVMRQWHRHRMWSYNEISARYCELDEGYYIPAVEQMTTQGTGNKQMRTNEQHPLATELVGQIKTQTDRADRVYRQLLASGCPRELARSVLPLNAYTRMFATVDMHNLLHFLRLRLHVHAQFEIRVYAAAIARLIEQVAPRTTMAFQSEG